VLVVIALLVPALFHYTERGVFASADVAAQDEKLSLCVAIVLIVIYGANVVYTLVTDRDVFAPNEPREARVEAFLSNSFGFGGMNAVVAVRLLGAL